MATTGTAAEEGSYVRVDVPMSCDQLDGNTRPRLRKPYGSKDLISVKAASHNGSHGSNSKVSQVLPFLCVQFQFIRKPPFPYTTCLNINVVSVLEC
ncbi:hypothetical protein V6N12_022701 [Hibiscus sabdariffa]|uniref:Uncharacterized protein n=1 Tax=Hibiscus sabdariffa TaxID=183260 RepID=A0ABR2FVN9_9ROSI